jgi:hypothetical protein
MKHRRSIDDRRLRVQPAERRSGSMSRVYALDARRAELVEIDAGFQQFDR